MAKKKIKQSDNIDNERLCAILSYLIIGIIWYFADEKMKKSSFVKFHAKQGIVLLIVAIIYSFALQVLFSVLFFPLLFMGNIAGLAGLLYLLGWLPIIWTILGIINAANDKEKELPIIGKFAEKLTF